MQLKLLPGLVPEPLWGKSVCNVLRNTGCRSAWEKLRGTVLEESSNKCHYCSASYESHMVCHEVWEYDDLNGVATLVELLIVCRDCNSVLHVGMSLVIGSKRGKSEIVDRGEQALQHLRKVNRITRKEARKLVDDAFLLFD
jgi:hypothetical protein